MSSPDEIRVPPEVIRVLPPPAIPLPLIMVLAIGLLVGASGVLMFIGQGGWTPFSALWVAVGAVGPFVFTIRNRRRCARHNQVRAELFEESRDSADRAMVATIRKEWARFYPRFSELEPTFSRLPPPDPPAARVVLLGLVDVPRISDYRCEPEIATPSQAVAEGLLPLLIFGAVFCLLELVRMFSVPIPGAPDRKTLIIILAFAWSVWALRAFLQPTYVRFAPGIVEVLKFRLRGGKPTIRRYPMEPGTRVIITDKRSGYQLDLQRDEHHDRISLKNMRHAEAVLKRLVRAMLSTAPIPTMSEEELVG